MWKFSVKFCFRFASIDVDTRRREGDISMSRICRRLDRFISTKTLTTSTFLFPNAAAHPIFCLFPTEFGNIMWTFMSALCNVLYCSHRVQCIVHRIAVLIRKSWKVSKSALENLVEKFCLLIDKSSGFNSIMEYPRGQNSLHGNWFKQATPVFANIVAKLNVFMHRNRYRAHIFLVLMRRFYGASQPQHHFWFIILLKSSQMLCVCCKSLMCSKYGVSYILLEINFIRFVFRIFLWIHAWIAY